MKKLQIFLMILAATAFTQLTAKEKKNFGHVVKHVNPAPAEPTIRVLIAKDIHAALLEVKGAYSVVKEDTRDQLSAGSAGKRFVVQPIDAGLRWGEEYPDIYQISVLPKDASTMMYVNGLQYKGSLSIYCTPKGEISIVNHVPIEDYLKSTLAAEALPSKEALASMVIAERTAAYVLAMQNKESDRLYDVAAATTNYWGHGVTKQKGGIDELVDNTKHIVLLNGEAPVLNIAFSKEHAQELADKGFDAKKILKSICPEAALGSPR